MVEFLVMAFFLVAGVYCFASIANAWQRKKLEESEPLVPVNTSEIESCKLHKWRELTLLKPEQIEEFKMNPDKFSPNQYCEVCGYAPTLQMQVAKKARKMLQEQEALVRETRERAKEIKELSEDFCKAAVKHLGINEALEPTFRAGYDAYAQFVAVLPELVERNRVKKLMKKFKEPS